MEQRFFLSEDPFGEYVVIPVAYRDDWLEWLLLDETDPRCGTMPSYVVHVGKFTLEYLTFTDPVETPIDEPADAPHARNMKRMHDVERRVEVRQRREKLHLAFKQD